MSFTAEVKRELAHLPAGDLCCARAELAAALRASGGISFRGMGRYALSVTSADGSVVRRYFAMVKQHFGVTGEISVIDVHTISGERLYRLTLPEEEGKRLLQEIGLWDEQAMLCIAPVPAPGITEKECCLRAFIRGAFLMCGTADNPDKEYYLEFACPTEELADHVMEIAKKCEILIKKACRKHKFVVYCKKAERISDLLALMGAANAMMKLETVRVRKDVNNGINRQMNCDSSNIARTTGAAQSQLTDIELIEDVIGLKNLPATLRAAAEARVNAPDVSLTELGKLMEPPLGKSGVNARMRRLSDLAERIRNGTYKGGKTP